MRHVLIIDHSNFSCTRAILVKSVSRMDPISSRSKVWRTLSLRTVYVWPQCLLLHLSAHMNSSIWNSLLTRLPLNSKFVIEWSRTRHALFHVSLKPSLLFTDHCIRIISTYSSICVLWYSAGVRYSLPALSFYKIGVLFHFQAIYDCLFFSVMHGRWEEITIVL